MKKSIIFALLLISLSSFAQLPGKKFKTPFKGIDANEYKVGDIVKLGSPSKGKLFDYISIYNKTTFLQTISAVAGTAASVTNVVASKGRDFGSASGMSGEPKPAFTSADETYSNQSAVIEYFSYYQDKKDPSIKVTFVAAKMVGNPTVTIVFDIESAIRDGELYSNNIAYSKIKESNLTADSTTLTQFSSKIQTQFLSVIGNKDKQEITVNLLLSHKSVHQVVKLVTDDQSAYDFEGNEYKSSLISIGSKSSSYDPINKVPTNVPVRVSVTFNKILPDVKVLRFVSIKVYFGDEVDSIYSPKNSGTLEIKNLKVNWQ